MGTLARNVQGMKRYVDDMDMEQLIEKVKLSWILQKIRTSVFSTPTFRKTEIRLSRMSVVEPKHSWTLC